MNIFDAIIEPVGAWVMNVISTLGYAGVVVCRTTGVVTDVDRLDGMIRVVREALDSLHRVGEARQQEVPGA